ncbi:metallophosphoesterase [Paenibacillus sp. JTLBN-2024]
MRKSLHFNSDGKFKIVQFTDTEFSRASEEETRMKAMMAKILEAEKPDLAVYTGDVIASGGSPDPVQAFKDAVSVPEEMQLPWAAVFGNHDSEAPNVTREQLHNLQLAHRYCYAQPDPPNVQGTGNYVLEILGRDHQAALYFLDSGSYSPLEHLRLGFYDWIRRSQIAWYTETSYRLTVRNGGSPLPSLGFFHILFPNTTMFGILRYVMGKSSTNIAARHGLTPAFLPPWWKWEISWGPSSDMTTEMTSGERCMVSVSVTDARPEMPI